MSVVMRRAVVWSLVLLLATATDSAARGGRGGGGGRGGFGGRGFSRGGAASGGSFGWGREAGGRREGGYAERGPADGSLREESLRRAAGEEGSRPPEDWQGGHEERQERRQERQERREDWHDDAGDYYGDDYDDGYYPYGAAGGEVLATPPWWTLDCAPPIDVNGTTYYECESAWYVRVFHDAEVAYARVNPPPGH